jgi:pilus assembly protein CpaC
MRQRAFATALLVVMVLPPATRTVRLAASPASDTVVASVEQVPLLVGRSAVIRTDRAITRVALSTPEIADAMVTSAREVLVHGKTPGTISLLVWTDNGRITTYEIAVRRDLSPLEAQILKQFPGEGISVASNGKDVVLSGVVSTKYIVDRAAALAVGYVEKAENVVNLLRQQESTATNQVLLRVRFAEVSRSAVQELGAGFFTGANGKGDWIGRSTTGQYPAPEFDQDKGLVFSDFLNLFAFNTEEQIGAVVKALKGKGLFQSLAEPNLITQDGKEASFLAGGEFPYPVVQGSGGNAAVTIVFKEFGVRLRFTPTITGDDLIHLKVAPEVSSLDFGNAVVLEGFRVPALATRRTETEVELRDGQTFAIAGLLDQNLNETLRRVPGIGDIPILGYLFRSQAYQKNATELVVMITPHIVRRDSPGVTPNLPGLVEPFLAPQPRTIAPPPPAFGSPVSQLAVPSSQRTAKADGAIAAPASVPQSGAPARLAEAVLEALDNAQTRPAATPVPGPSPAARASSAPAALARGASAAEQKALAAAKKEQQQALKETQARAERDRRALNIARKADFERTERERRIESKRAAEQAVLDRKRAAEQAVIDRERWVEQQKQAARAKEVGDKVTKEQARRDAERLKIETARLEEERKVAEKHQKAQDKLAREQAGRDDELEKLLTQYKKLSAGDAQQ